MAAFVFLAGSEVRPASWDACGAFLVKRGHTYRAIDWTKAPWEKGLLPAIGYLVSELSDIKDAVLVGHSVAGIFLPLLAERMVAKSEIYIAALASPSDRSLWDRLFAGEEIFDPGWVTTYGEAALSPGQSLSDHHRTTFEEYLFHDCPAGSFQKYWRPFPLPLDLFYEIRFSLQKAARPRHYIVCSGDRTIRPEWQRKVALELNGSNVPPTEFMSGHSPQLAKPYELACFLETLAEQA